MGLESSPDRRTGAKDAFERLSDAELESALWARAEEIAQQRAMLSRELDDVSKVLWEFQNKHLNLHEVDVQAEAERTYWRLKRAVDATLELDTRLETALRELAEGALDRTSLATLLDPHRSEAHPISKKKLAVAKERERLEKVTQDRSGFMFGAVPENTGVQTARLTTGKHATSISGNFHSSDAQSTFFDRTTDTHGGKVGHGKDGHTFRSKSGRRFRKR